jgi:hypothetical protein
MFPSRVHVLVRQKDSMIVETKAALYGSRAQRDAGSRSCIPRSGVVQESRELPRANASLM